MKERERDSSIVEEARTRKVCYRVMRCSDSSSAVDVQYGFLSEREETNANGEKSRCGARFLISETPRRALVCFHRGVLVVGGL